MDQYITSSLLKGNDRQAIHKHTDDKKSTQRRRNFGKASDRGGLELETSSARFLGDVDPDLLKDLNIRIRENRIDGVTLSINASASDQEIGERLAKMKEILDQDAAGDVEILTLQFRDGREDMQLDVASLVEEFAIKTIQAKFRYISPRIYKDVEVEVDATQTQTLWGRSFWERVRVKKVVVHVKFQQLGHGALAGQGQSVERHGPVPEGNLSGRHPFSHLEVRRREKRPGNEISAMIDGVATRDSGVFLT